MSPPLPAGVFRLSVPMPFVMPALNAWLVDSGDGWVLIDTGMRTTAGWNALQAAFLATGLRWADLRTVILTHMHPDHVGLFPQVREASGAALAMHVRDADLLNDFARPGVAEHWNQVALELAGSPAALIPAVNAAFRMLTTGFPSVSPEFPLLGGERFGSLEVIWSPGHSPGHLVIHDHARHILFSGDHILDSTSPNIGWLPEGDPLGDYLDSLNALAQLSFEQILPGHGEPIADHRAWIARTVAHHHSRLHQIRNLLAETPLSAHDISTRLWDRELSPINYRFAIFEVLAHLVYLRDRGAVTHSGVAWTNPSSEV